MTTKELLHSTEEKMKKTLDSVMREFSEIRTGRASPSLVEGLHINYYGTPTLLKQLASISVPDAHLIVIQPWDITSIAEIEKASAERIPVRYIDDDYLFIRDTHPALFALQQINGQGGVVRRVDPVQHPQCASSVSSATCRM